MYIGRGVSRKVISAIHWIVIFAAKKAEKVMTPGILKSQDIKSDFISTPVNYQVNFDNRF